MIQRLLTTVIDKENFLTLDNFLNFCERYLEYLGTNPMQAVIVSQNENHYRFYQYGKDANYQISRPINSRLMYDAGSFSAARVQFLDALASLRDEESTPELRTVLNKAVYTVQQTIGATLDALPAGASNRARKINGTLFENFIKLILCRMGVEAKAGIVKVPVVVQGQNEFTMNYQHDLIVSFEDQVKAIGSIKTSSKDRLAKIFVDKFLYSRLTESELPHIAIFLNDVQRKGKAPRYGVGATFLPGHFKGYTLKLNPLDGVYYCDIRPNMTTEPVLRDHIKTLDHLLCDDIWRFVQREETVPIQVREVSEDDVEYE